MANFTEKRLARAIIEGILTRQIETGSIDPTNKTHEELFEEFANVILKASSQSSSFTMIIDHSSGLLSKARLFLKKGDLEYAALFYATWIEHWANFHIRCLAERNGSLPEKQLSEMIRQVQLRGKLTWLITLLGGKTLPPKHLAAIDRISEFRNGFVHYKHIALDVDAPNPQEEKMKATLNTFESTIKYIQNLDRIVLARGVRRKIKEFASNPRAVMDKSKGS